MILRYATPTFIYYWQLLPDGMKRVDRWDTSTPEPKQSFIIKRFPGQTEMRNASEEEFRLTKFQ